MPTTRLVVASKTTSEEDDTEIEVVPPVFVTVDKEMVGMIVVVGTGSEPA